MINKIWKFTGIMFCAGTVSLASPWTAGAETDPPLPPGPGRQAVEDNCTACHSPALILQNRMSRSRWDETITWMQKEQGLWELDRELRNQILDYLETVRGPGSPADKKRPQASHMYEYHYPPNPL